MKSIVLLLLIGAGQLVVECAHRENITILLAFDGLRHDFITREHTPTMYRLAHEGVFAPRGILPQVYTTTMGNFVSIATGLFQESHGIIGNTFWDPEWDEYFDYFNYMERHEGQKVTHNESKWYTGRPIWQVSYELCKK